MAAFKNLKKQALFDKIAAIDLSRVKAKLISSSGWTTEKTDNVEELYRVFLYVCGAYRGERFVPTQDIDDMWHTHILDTICYMDDCDNVFGYYLHHTPAVQPTEEERNWEMEHFQLTQEKVALEFGLGHAYQTAFAKAKKAGKIADCACDAGCSDDDKYRPRPIPTPKGPVPQPRVDQIGTV